ncbi:hypothetical protein BH10CHL1_BH10CHL1_47880 [soil metagenome]
MREQAIESKGNAAKRLAVLANLSEEVKAQLLFLRRRPESLEQFEARVRMIYEVYAMNLGRDITFWFPTPYSGHAYRTKNEIQGEERAAVESNVFHPKFQEALQRYVVPQTVHFEFSNPSVSDRDELFRLRDFAEVAKTLYESYQETGDGQRQYLVSRNEVRLYLAEGDARFSRLTVEQEATNQTQNDMDLARSLPAVQSLTEGYRRGWWPDEQLIERSWQFDKLTGRETVTQRALPWRVAELAQPRVWVVTQGGTDAKTID